MKLPRVGSIFRVGKEFEMPIASGSEAKMAHIDLDFNLQIIANGEDGPLMKITNPLFLGRPVAQFSDKLILKMTFKDLVDMKKSGWIY